MVVSHQLCSPPTLVQRDFLERPLDLDHVQRLALYPDGRFEDGAHFSELVGVAGDEVDEVAGRAWRVGRGHVHVWISQ